MNHTHTPVRLSRLVHLAAAALLVSAATGCSIIDRLFLLNADGPYANHRMHGGACQDGACEDGACQQGACGPEGCPTGGCQTCQDGTCRTPHVGRYGGLAKHHLSPEERAAVEGSDYGAIAPAGPPTGAVAYPYYTTRGPRDFLAKNPPSIGP